MSAKSRIRAMERADVDRLLHVACLRFAFLRNTDAQIELARLLVSFEYVTPPYERCAELAEAQR